MITNNKVIGKLKKNCNEYLIFYFQVLRVAMIELINDDYADFVNLSSNLVGIDDKIVAIEDPVKEFKEQIFSFQTKLNLTKDKLEAKLAQRKTLHDQRVALR